ncbi:MAG TPA: sigma-70 family RNA polymerase sigma factor [Gemmatimonadota bacterium]|nr:sigma-70 family RNA polymerase sigma factor [Gemmatimonadota bacterium]
MSDLVERAQRGEAGAFDRLYREHVERVYAICLRLSADPLRAEGLTQDVFVRAWRRLDSFRGESRFSTWLHRIAVNAFMEDHRSMTRRGRRIETTGPGGLEAYSIAIQSGAPDTRLDLERAIAALPRGARTMIVLHDVEGYRYEEVAALTGVALGTVKSQIHRGRRLLREALG